jgi:serine/threonine protein kinase
MADTADPKTVVQLPELLREPPVEGVVRGTPGYMAPEQERGDFQALDPRTDIFALGALLNAILRRQTPPRQPPAALRSVVTKAMSAAADKRYQTAEQLTTDVRAFVGGYAVSAQTVGPGTLLWLLIKRHKAVSTVALVSALTIATLLAVFIVRIKQGERRALDMLARLSAEQAEKARLGRYAAPRLMSLAQELIRNNDYDEALANLGLCAVFDTNMTAALQMKGFVHLGRQEFDEAVTTFDRVLGFERRAKRDVSLRAGELAEKYQRLASPTGSLSDPQLLLLIADISNRTNGFRTEHREVALGQMFFRLNQTRRSDPVHLQFVGVAISRLNPSATNVAFSFRTEEAGTTIELHGDRVTQILPLVGLRLHALDVSGTEVEDLRWIRDSGLQVLDLSGRSPKAGSRVGDLAPLFTLPITELRLVNCPRIRFDQLRSLPKLEKVVVSKAQTNTVQRILSQSRIAADVAGE